MKKIRKKIFFVVVLISVLLITAYSFLVCYSQEPIQLNTETEDIALTDDINIAKAQVAKYPENPEAHFNLAIAFSRTSAVEDAVKELRKTKRLIRKPENAGVMDKKIREFKEILANNPEANNIRYRLAFSHYLKAYLKSKEIEKDLKEKGDKNNSQKSNKNKDPIKLDLFNSQRLISQNKNPEIKENLELSISYFKDLLKKNPSDNWAKIYYGFILAEQMGEVSKARELWSEVLKHNPNNPAPYFFLGELHIKEGNLKQGITEISQALLLRSLGN